MADGPLALVVDDTEIHRSLFKESWVAEGWEP